MQPTTIYHLPKKPHVTYRQVWYRSGCFMIFNHLGSATKYNRMDTSSPRLDQRSCPYGFGWPFIQQATGPMGRPMSTWGCEHWLFNPKVQNQRMKAMKYNLSVQLGYTCNPSTTPSKMEQTHQLAMPTNPTATNHLPSTWFNEMSPVSPTWRHLPP